MTVAALAVLQGLFAQPTPAQDKPCSLKAGPVRAVVRVIDAETILLDDNQEVRLIGALAPRSPDMSADAAPWPPEQRAADALRDLVLGRSVELAYSGRRFDRYGRLLSHLFLNRDGERIWVQGRMLSNGYARAYGLPGSFACIRELLAHERVARAAGAGLWANAAYATRLALRPRALIRRRNTYQIVEGQVVHVAMTKSRTYLNFGKDWRTDFTAGIRASLLRKNPEWAKALAALEGQRVEVRGWIEYRNGPYIKIEDPSQIETTGVSSPAPSSSSSGGLTVSGERGKTAPQKQRRPAQKRPDAFDLRLP